MMPTPPETDEPSADTPAAGTKPKAAKQAAPWSVRGVSLEARAKAAKAARRRRMTLGEWVDNALIAMANEELGTGPARAREAERGEAAPERAVVVEAERGAGERPADALERLERPSQELVAVSERLAKLDKLHDALGALGRHLEARERRERNMLVMMHNLSERAKQNESKITNLLEMVGRLVGRGLPWGAPSAAPAVAPASGFATPALSSPPLPRPQSASVPHPASVPAALAREAPAPSAGTAPEVPAAALKLDFDSLNKKAMENAKRARGAPTGAEPPERKLLSKILRRGENDDIV